MKHNLKDVMYTIMGYGWAISISFAIWTWPNVHYGWKWLLTGCLCMMDRFGYVAFLFLNNLNKKHKEEIILVSKPMPDFPPNPVEPPN